MSNEPAKKPTAATPADSRHPDAPPGYDVRMQWIKLTMKDMTIGSKGLYDRVEARKMFATGEMAPNGCDILWSPTHRHYWIGIYDNNKLINEYEIVDTIVSPRQQWRG